MWFSIIKNGVVDTFHGNVNIQHRIDTANNRYGYGRMVASNDYSIDIYISIENNKTNLDYFFKLYDGQSGYKYKSNYIFDINSAKFKAMSCRLKSILMDEDTIKIEIIADYSTIKDISEIRDEIIDQVLNQTSENKKI